MPRVKVKYFSGLRQLLSDTKEEEYEVRDGTRLIDLLLEHIPGRHWRVSRSWKQRIFETEKGEIKFDEDGTPVFKRHYMLWVNGKSYVLISEDGRRAGLQYKLKSGDVIAVFPPVGGG